MVVSLQIWDSVYYKVLNNKEISNKIFCNHQRIFQILMKMSWRFILFLFEFLVDLLTFLSNLFFAFLSDLFSFLSSFFRIYLFHISAFISSLRFYIFLFLSDLLLIIFLHFLRTYYIDYICIICIRFPQV